MSSTKKLIFVLCSLTAAIPTCVQAFAPIRPHVQSRDEIPLGSEPIRQQGSSTSLFCVESTSERSYKEGKIIRSVRQSPRMLLGGPLRSALMGESVPTTRTSSSPKVGLVATFCVLLEKLYLQSRRVPVWWPWLALSLIVMQSSGMALATKALGGMQSGILWYSAALDSAPIITKAITAGVIGVMGDFLAQALELRKHRKQAATITTAARTPIQQLLNKFTLGGRYNSRRGLSILFDGLFISGPLLHHGFEMFEHFMPIANGGGILAAFTHVVADTVLLDSLFVASQFWVTGLFEGFSIKDTWNQFKSDYVPTLKAGGITTFMMSPIELLCFRFLPLSFRVLAVNIIDIVWDGVISFMTHKSRGENSQKHVSVPEETPLLDLVQPALTVTFLEQLNPMTNSSLAPVAV